jgi:hypothetical protein
VGYGVLNRLTEAAGHGTPRGSVPPDGLGSADALRPGSPRLRSPRRVSPGRTRRGRRSRLAGRQ